MPVVSWFIEGGKCRHCGTPISMRYLLIELVTAVACTAAFIFFGFEPKLVVALIGIVAFITLATINFERGRD
jgi:leader peptidase (prepilin peptidase)/N-methyltransferase